MEQNQKISKNISAKILEKMFNLQEEHKSFYQAFLDNRISYSTYRRYFEYELTEEYMEFRKNKFK